MQPPDLRHWFGTDQLGRDVFTRVVYGTSLSLSIGVGATLIASAGGIVLGHWQVLRPRAVRQLLVRLLDIMLAFPDLLLALLAITVLGVGQRIPCWRSDWPALLAMPGWCARKCCRSGYRGMCSMRWRWESRQW
ncbi:peptide ABC transporter permease [Klebsiella variicola]|uniref:Peptide ABC transporter permease n=1 Tax=Klebsiella variicola TaxID=244366 RepID=A0A7H4MK89_KLEVA|nr:peptide ABC transporter permease [Klebsiella variicola]